MTSSDSGWSNNDLGFAWLSQVFEPQTRSGRPRVLVMDGHGSHLSWRFVAFAAEHGISLACLPPNTTHLLQPLDVGLFGPEAHWLSEELLRPSLASANALTDRKMLECIVRARPRAFTARNIRSAWRKTGIWPPSLRNALSGVQDPRPATPPPTKAALDADLLRTPARAADVDALLDRLVDDLDLTPRRLEPAAKLAKAAKRGMAALALALGEIGDLREAADRQERRKERLPGPEGMLLDIASGRTLAEELRRKQEERDLAKRRTAARKEMLEELKRRGEVRAEGKRLPKRFEASVEAYLQFGGLLQDHISTEASTSNGEQAHVNSS